MELIAIKETLEENSEYLNDPSCAEIVKMSVDFYTKVGFVPPWICYLTSHEGNMVGGAAIKGRPVNGTVEVSYGTFDKYQKTGIGTMICGELVKLCRAADPTLKITARTLSDNIPSHRILQKNNFVYTGIVVDPDDGPVWEWVWQPQM